MRFLYSFVVRSIITHDADANRYLYEAEEQDITKPLASEQLLLHETLQDNLKEAVRKIVRGGSLLDFQYNETDGFIDLLAIIQTPQNFSSKQVRSLQAYLQKNVNKKIKLVVRSVVGIDMDDKGFLVPELAKSKKPNNRIYCFSGLAATIIKRKIYARIGLAWQWVINFPA